MRRLIALASAAVLALAACTGSPATSTPTQLPAGTEPPASAEPTRAPVDVRVTFDGERCVYQGPTVLLEGTVLRVEYAPTVANPDDTMLLLAGVLPGTTLEMVLDEANLEYNVPPWLVLGYMTQQYGPGTTSYTITSFHQEPLGGHFVGCGNEAAPDDYWPATLLLIAGG
jgi:hypothetical protein